MDWLTSQLPDYFDMTFWLGILCIALAALNVYQYALAHKMLGWVAHLEEHGHAPEGKAIVPADSIAHVIDEPRIVSPSQIDIPPWERKA